MVRSFRLQRESEPASPAPIRQPLEPFRQVPVPVAEQLHRRREEHGANHGRVVRVKPDDSRWQSVLVHVNGSRISTCSARIARSGWQMYPDHVDGWDYWLPNKVSARCGRSAFSAQPERVPWGLTGFMHAILGSTPIRGRSGWIEHATPVFPNV